MLFRFLSSRPCSIRSMFYMLSLISLCVGLHLWILDGSLSFSRRVRSALSAVSFFSPRFEHDDNTKYVLSWDHQYFNFSDQTLSNLDCSVKNCFFTADRDFLSDLRVFHAVVFGDKSLNSSQRPETRSQSQIYIFMSTASSYVYPACELYNDDYFNWTFTYRLDSDVLWRNFVVRNSSGAIVAPALQVTWTENTTRPRPVIRPILQKKMRAIAWFRTDCNLEMVDYIQRLERHLYHFALTLDKYKQCTKLNRICQDILIHYHFVLAFEDSFAEDYVSEKVLDGYRNYAVPVVYGEANYSRFLPPGSYINARELHPYNLAHAIYKASLDMSALEEYFKWTNVYSIEHWGTKTYASICDLCAALHEDKAKDAPAKKNFRTWWNSPNNMHRCLPDESFTIDKKFPVNHSDNYIFPLPSLKSTKF